MLNFPTSKLEVCHVTIPVPGLLSQYDGLRLVQLSDFHFDVHALADHGALHPGVLPDVIQQVQALQPDLICYTGDFINGDPDTIELLCQSLRKISGRLGNYAVLGNHDFFSPEAGRRVTNSLEKANIQILNNEVCYPFGPDLALVGFCCRWQFLTPPRYDPAAVMAQIPSHIPKIVLAHSPLFAEFLTPWTIELQLSGHTHGGQLAVPGLGPLIPLFWRCFARMPGALRRWSFSKIPRRIRMTHVERWFRGLYEENQGYLYVNRGLGAHAPGRLFCRPEMTVIQLQAGTKA